MDEEIRSPEAATPTPEEISGETTGNGAEAAPKKRTRSRSGTSTPRKPRAKAKPAPAEEAPAPEAVTAEAADRTAEPEAVQPEAVSPGAVEDGEPPVEAAEAERSTLPASLVETALADQPADLLLSLGHVEVESTGEAVSANRTPAAGGANELILVPEASEETAPFLEIPPDTRPPAIGLPPITPELLAEVRANQDQRPRRERGRKGQEKGQPQRPPEPVQALPAELELELIVVPEALLESVPAEWAEEDAAAELRPALPGEEGQGRRRRRRRGDRRNGREETAVETPTPPPTPQVGPIILGRGDEDRERRERERPETRTEREYKEILINTGDRETRIAVMENGKLVELHVEREERVVGNVAKGRVANVLPGMDAAFVDIGLERNAFLYVGDILFEDPSAREGSSTTRKTSRDVKIKDLAKPGQEILVQVVKGPRGTKGARVSTKMSIPGRYLVLMPDGDHLGVSRKVEDARERDRLKRIADRIQPKGFGLIVRTEAEGRTDQELQQDLEYLLKTWEKIQEKAKRAHAPALLHKDLGIILKTIRDLFGQDVDKLVLDDREEYEKVVDTLQQLAPDLLDRVQLYDEPTPLFTRYNLEEEIDRLLRRKVWLRNGAYLLIDTTEALTTIDVNTGKFVGTSSLAETILKTNLDAVDEIARQLRLRDIGGMIVLDFIDMASSRDRQLVMRKLEEAFRRDRTRTKIAHISPLGLVEMTRKRTAENVTDLMTQVCSYCQGRGRHWSPETVAIQIEREILKLCADREVDAVLVHANPEVAAWVIGAEGEGVERLERMIRRPVYVRAQHELHIEKFEVMGADMMEMEREMHPFHGGQVVECRVQKLDLITPPRSAAWADGYFVDLANGAKLEGQRVKVRLTDVRRSFALGEPVAPSTAVDKSEPI